MKLLSRVKDWYDYNYLEIVAYTSIALIGSLILLAMYFDVKHLEEEHRKCAKSLCSQGKTPVLLSERLCICEELPRKAIDNGNN